ncbi:MAG: ATPase [Sphingobium sp.]|nr:ATPase [Sphingobium sp.]
MKRFYKEVSTVALGDGHHIHLDGRPVRTPARMALALPNAALAEAIAQEWRDQGEKIDPASMPITGLANAAIDQIAPNPTAFAETISVYGESDLLCYRADTPSELVAHQAKTWQPLLDWASARYDISFTVTSGIIHVAQSPATLARLREIVGAQDAFTMAALSPLVSLSGSLVISLAVIENAFERDALWQAAELDEIWQAAQWGEDDEATARRAIREAEFHRTARFADLVRGR